MKAVALLSGGLDGMLAAKIMLDLGIEVYAVHFTSPLFASGNKPSAAESAAKQLKVSLKTIELEDDYMKMLRNPKHGYGANMNPCIDCKIFMMKKAYEYAKEIGAKFLITGEVMGQRPMSQHKGTMEMIEEEAGLKGKILRPLSAKLLAKTEAEQKGWVDREKLLDINGRGRTRQIELANKFNLKYPSPAGGCLLTQIEFAEKLRDYFNHNKKVSMQDINLLKIGRHFRFDGNKIIVGRNEKENEELMKLKNKSDYFFEVKNCGSPVTILQGKKTKHAIEKAAQLTARYCDKKEKEIEVSYGKEKTDKSITVSCPEEKEMDEIRI
jgi:tRNA U34 2-thiouridine synthase MnmA/TrmU